MQIRSDVVIVDVSCVVTEVWWTVMVGNPETSCFTNIHGRLGVVSSQILFYFIFSTGIYHML